MRDDGIMIWRGIGKLEIKFIIGGLNSKKLIVCNIIIYDKNNIEIHQQISGNKYIFQCDESSKTLQIKRKFVYWNSQVSELKVSWKIVASIWRGPCMYRDIMIDDSDNGHVA